MLCVLAVCVKFWGLSGRTQSLCNRRQARDQHVLFTRCGCVCVSSVHSPFFAKVCARVPASACVLSVFQEEAASIALQSYTSASDAKPWLAMFSYARTASDRSVGTCQRNEIETDIDFELVVNELVCFLSILRYVQISCGRRFWASVAGPAGISYELVSRGLSLRRFVKLSRSGFTRQTSKVKTVTSRNSNFCSWPCQKQFLTTYSFVIPTSRPNTPNL